MSIVCVDITEERSEASRQADANFDLEFDLDLPAFIGGCLALIQQRVAKGELSLPPEIAVLVKDRNAERGRVGVRRIISDWAAKAYPSAVYAVVITLLDAHGTPHVLLVYA